MIFEEKCFSCYILLTDQTSLSDAFTSGELGNMWVVTIFFPVDDVRNLKYLAGSKRVITKKIITLPKKVITKIWIFHKRKRLLRWNLKNFSLFLKGVQRSKLFEKQHFLVWARPWIFSFSQKSFPADAKITKARVLSGKSYLVR